MGAYVKEYHSANDRTSDKMMVDYVQSVLGLHPLTRAFWTSLVQLSGNGQLPLAFSTWVAVQGRCFKEMAASAG